MNCILNLTHSGNWKSNLIFLWSDKDATLQLDPYMLDRKSVTSVEHGFHYILRECVIKNMKGFPLDNARFIIVPIGKLLRNYRPTDWIVVYGEDKQLWLLRDEVPGYIHTGLGGYRDWDSDDGDIADWCFENWEDQVYTEEVEALGKPTNIACLGSLEGWLDQSSGSNTFPASLKLYDGDWSTIPVNHDGNTALSDNFEEA